MKYCPQCNKHKPNRVFVRNGSERNVCTPCFKTYYAAGAQGHRDSRRSVLDAHSELRVSIFASTQKNRKLGNIPSTMTTAVTCPDACAFKDSGCFAEFGFLRYFWELTELRGYSWEVFCEHVADLPEGQLWRHNVAGDLPGKGDALDIDRLMLLTAANLMAGARGFTFTHKPLRDERERAAVRQATSAGFVINVSADSLTDADEKAKRCLGPIAVVLPIAAERGLKTPAGQHVVICPAETHGLTCEQCQLCAQPERKSVVGFRAHGQWKKRVNELVQLRRSA